MINSCAAISVGRRYIVLVLRNSVGFMSFLNLKKFYEFMFCLKRCYNYGQCCKSVIHPFSFKMKLSIEEAGKLFALLAVFDIIWNLLSRATLSFQSTDC